MFRKFRGLENRPEGRAVTISKDMARYMMIAPIFMVTLLLTMATFAMNYHDR